MRLGTTVATERAVEDDIGPGLTGAAGDVPDVVAADRATVQQHLPAVGCELGRLGSPEVRHLSGDRNALQRDALATDRNAVHRLVDRDVACPAVFAADPH